MIGRGLSNKLSKIKGIIYRLKTIRNNFIPRVVSGGPLLPSSSSLSVEALVASSSLVKA